MYRRRRYRKYRRRRPKKYTAYRVYKTLNSKVNAINKANRPEMRVSDHTGTDCDIYTTGTITKINSGPSIGYDHKIHSIQLRGILELDTETAAVTSIARVILFIDRRNTDPDNDTIAWTDVWKTENVWSIRALSTSTDNEHNRFNILFDKTYYLNADTDGTTMSKRLVNYYKKFKRPIVACDGATANGGEKNALYIAYISNTATTVMDFDYQLRFRFTEQSG